MIVLLDSTALVSNPRLAGIAWKVLAQAVDRGDVKVCVTAVVVLEASAGIERRLEEARSELESWKRKNAGPLGLKSELTGIQDALDASRQTVREDLEAALESIPVEVIGFPEVSHEVLVSRAAHRIPPCDKKGNGYRDTLNWFSILSLLENSNELIFWVSNDLGDFAGSDRVTLHPSLEAELAAAGHQGRVDLLRSLSEAAFRVAAASTTASEGELRAIQERLTLQTLAAFVRSEMLADLPAVEVSARQLALPLAAQSPCLLSVGEMINGSFEVSAPLDEQEAAVEITLDCEAEIAFGVPPGTTVGPQYFVLDENALVVGTRKPVRIVAFLTVDKFDRPTSCEISEVSALETDPGHALWRDAIRKRISDETGAAISRMAANIAIPKETRDAINRMAANIAIPKETRDAINRMAANIAKQGRSGSGKDESQPSDSDPGSGTGDEAGVADEGDERDGGDDATGRD